MPFTRKTYEPQDFIRIRDFLKNSLQNYPHQKNWLIDRWNFTRYFTQVMHESFDIWPATVGIWEDENKEIVALVHSEGKLKGRTLGEAFLQLCNRAYSDEFLIELLEYAEKVLLYKTPDGPFLNLRVNEEAEQLKAILRKRNYILHEWREPMSSMLLKGQYEVKLPEGFHIVDANEVNDYQKGFAHGKAFGYYNGETPDDDDAERSYRMLRKAPDYLPELDLAVLDQNGEIASFTTVWYDDLNKIGILEPVGTNPKYRKMGLGKAVIYEGVNRVRAKGAEKMCVSSDQQFYHAIGFSLEYAKEIWHKKF